MACFEKLLHFHNHLPNITLLTSLQTSLPKPTAAMQVMIE